MPRPVRRRLKRIVQKHSDADYRRRANALLMLHNGLGVQTTAQQLQASRNSIREWRRRYQCHGECGLAPEPRGRPASTVNDTLCSALLALLTTQPGDHGYLRSRWTSELLALQLREKLSATIHASTVRRLLPKLGIEWHRARPTLCINDPKKAEKMRSINLALASASDAHPVFYVDEADVDLNPRIGSCWTPKGKQATIPTPGKNGKRYLAGALNAKTGNVVWVGWPKKNSEIFLLLMAALRKRYRQAKSIRLIADNYIIHKSFAVSCFLQHNPKFQLLFQPIYHPWVNRIELVWLQLHEAITRNHRHATINQLMADSANRDDT